MSRAYLSDTVLDGSGKPVVGADIALLRANDYPAPPTADPGSNLYAATTTSGPGGAFSFDHIVPDDYHLMVRYAGQTIFKYFVPAISTELADLKSTHGRVLVPRLLSRILGGESVCIHFVGDSITVGYNSTGTVGGSLVQRMGVLIGQQLAPNASVQRFDPNAYGTLQDAPINGWNGPTQIQAPSNGSSQVIQVVNNGVSGDTVQRVLRRFGNLTGWTPPVDALFIYLGINDSLSTDATKFVDPESFHAGMLALIQIIRNYYPQAEIIVSTPHHNDQPDAGNGGSVPAGMYTLDQYAMATRRAALETGSALVDLRQLWADAYNATDPNFSNNDGYPSSWLSTAGGNHTHPSDQGHQVIAEEMFKVFGVPGLAAGRAQRIHTLGAVTHHKDMAVVRLPNTSPALVFAGTGWIAAAAELMSYLYYLTTLSVSSVAGDTLTFTDRFQDFALLLKRGSDCGIVSVSVDGGPPVQYDLYRGLPASTADTIPDGAVYPTERLWIARGLGDTTHTVVVTITESSNPASSGRFFYSDGAEYTRWDHTSQKLECPIELSKIQYGALSATFDGSSYFATIALTFPRPFRSGNTPTVVASANDVHFYCSVDAITNQTCNIRLVQAGESSPAEGTTKTGQWIAIG